MFAPGWLANYPGLRYNNKRAATDVSNDESLRYRTSERVGDAL